MKYKCILILPIFTLLLGCGAFDAPKEQQVEKNDRFEITSSGELPVLMIDRETGCQYVSNGYDTPYTLLYDRDGKPYCPGAAAK
ncbi:DUF6440 family protein [Paenibacillus jiagnxiensis]|uniref:DUF6440 family protein n=1 Tax=Paenibacillus jiagnxiensis TaxID=3228926 RepID=UPI0033B27AC0